MKALKMRFAKSAFLRGAAAGLVTLFLGGIANAQSNAQAIPAGVTSETDLKNVLCRFIGFFFWIVLVISVIMVLWAAFTYVTAGDNQEKVSKGRKIIMYAAIGIAVALLAQGLPTLVGSIFPNNIDLAGKGCTG